jgi:hypothetical protein
VRVRTPGDIVASLPALIGYHARDSIVLVLLGGQPSQVRLTMRLDMPQVRDDAVWPAVSRAFLPGVRNADADEAVLVLLDGDEQSADALAGALSADLDDNGVGMRDVLVVREGRYRSILCDDVACCPPQGALVPTTGAATAAAAVTGQVIAASRDELRAEFAPPQPEDGQRAATAFALMVSSAWHGSLDDCATEFPGYLDEASTAAAEGCLSLEQAVRLACLVRVGEYRDQAYLHLVEGDIDHHRAMWGSVCRQLPREHTVVPHVMLALAAYLQGEGALATVALEAAEQVNAEHASVRLLSDVIAAGIPPREVRAALARCMAPRH